MTLIIESNLSAEIPTGRLMIIRQLSIDFILFVVLLLSFNKAKVTESPYTASRTHSPKRLMIIRH